MMPVTVQPTRDQLRALASRAADDGYTGNDDYGHLTVSPAVLTAILDQLDQAEAEVKRLSWKCGHLADKYAQDTDELRQEADQAEACIQAVRDIHVSDGHGGAGCGERDCYPSCVEDGEDWPCPTIRALEG